MKKITATSMDLAHIHNLAVNNCVRLSLGSKYNKDSSLVQAYSWTEAVLTWLNSKDIKLDHTVEVDNGEGIK